MKELTKQEITHKWVCDWCDFSTIMSNNEEPPGWFNDSDTDNTYCSYGCKYISHRTWKETFDIGMEARNKAFEEAKEKAKELHK